MAHTPIFHETLDMHFKVVKVLITRPIQKIKLENFVFV